MTGLINVSIKTLNLGRVEAMGILTGYMAILTALALVLDYKNISVKL